MRSCASLRRACFRTSGTPSLEGQPNRPLLVERSADRRRPFHVFDAGGEVRVCHALLAPDGVDELLLDPPAAAFRGIDLYRRQLALAALAGGERQRATDRLPQSDGPLGAEDMDVRQ